MANRFPLVLDTDTTQIREIPEGDLLNLQGSGITNLTGLTVSGQLAGATLSLSGNATISGTLAGAAITATNITASGTVDASALTIGGEPISLDQVQSDWAESDVNSPAYILNKPFIPSVPESIYDLNDVRSPELGTDGHVLTLDGSGNWYPAAPQGGGIGLDAFSVITNPASGNGSLAYNDSNGQFSFTPANVPTSVSQLLNDQNYITLTQSRTGISVISGVAIGQGSLTYNNASGEFTFNPSAGLLPGDNISELTNDSNFVSIDTVISTISVLNNTASGSESRLEYDGDPNSPTAGQLSFTPAVVPTALGDLVNDTGFVTIGEVDSAGYITAGDVQAGGDLSRTEVGGVVTITADLSAYLTAESDTLATVTGRGSLTTDAITVARINTTDNATASSFQGIEALSITLNAGGMTSTNGDITLTNGALNVTNGTLTANNITVTGSIDSQVQTAQTITGRTDTLDLQAATADDRVRITQGWLNLRFDPGKPPTPAVGDVAWNGNVLEVYTANDGSGSPAWLHVAGESTTATRGLILPTFTTTERNALPAVLGETILNVTTGKLEVYVPALGWVAIGP